MMVRLPVVCFGHVGGPHLVGFIPVPPSVLEHARAAMRFTVPLVQSPTATVTINERAAVPISYAFSQLEIRLHVMPDVTNAHRSTLAVGVHDCGAELAARHYAYAPWADERAFYDSWAQGIMIASGSDQAWAQQFIGNEPAPSTQPGRQRRRIRIREDT